MDQRLQDEYQLEISAGFSSLERVGDDAVRVDPNMAYDDDPYTDIYEDAVYGGRIDPGETQDFYIYEVEWPEGVEHPSIREVEELGEELDDVFSGWIVDEDGERVFALRRDEGGAREQARRQKEND
jgi:hypothetical protein